MEEFIEETLLGYPDAVLLVVIAVMLGVLAKFADLVVDYAVVLSQRSGVPKVIIGATVVSLGTTAPEVAICQSCQSPNQPRSSSVQIRPLLGVRRSHRGRMDPLV